MTTILSESTRLRYAMGALLYFAQGIPYGILSIAMPAWLASEGASAGDIGSYLAIIALPWAFKLLSGPLMDRFEFLPMGRRRPWVIAAQLGLALALLSLTLIESPVEQVMLLAWIGFLVNVFAATQDVAVDGMAIDITPVREQGRLNASMTFGKSIGWSITGAVAGTLLVAWGPGPTGLVAAAASLLPLLAIVVTRERSGERRLPWSAGEAKSRTEATASFRSVAAGLNKVLWRPASLVILVIMFLDGLIYGYGHALMPLAAVKLFDYTTEQWSQMVAVMGLVGAAIALALGPLIDRLGARNMLMLTIGLVGVHALVLAQTQHLWTDTTYVRVMLSLYVTLIPVVMVAVLALAMSICGGPVSATQFAIYMSVANMGISVGSKVYGVVAERATYVQSYFLLAVLVALMIVALLCFRHRPAPSPAGDRAPRPHATLVIGSGASTFWSGALRCPKCRADMTPQQYEDVEVDRCDGCDGLWFDAGELELVTNRSAAAALDTGNARVGRAIDHHRDYRCPRCGGAMHAGADARQPHIRLETCAGCAGTFLDAGELRDLASFTPGDFLRGLFARRRDGREPA